MWLGLLIRIFHVVRVIPKGQARKREIHELSGLSSFD